MYVLKTAKCPPGCNGNTRFSLSIHIRERPVLQTEACVHMSLNNNSINIQCFHYCQKQRAPSLGCIGIERKAAQTPTEKKTCVSAPFSLRLVLTGGCMFYESRQKELERRSCYFSYLIKKEGTAAFIVFVYLNWTSEDLLMKDCMAKSMWTPEHHTHIWCFQVNWWSCHLRAAAAHSVGTWFGELDDGWFQSSTDHSLECELVGGDVAKVPLASLRPLQRGGPSLQHVQGVWLYYLIFRPICFKKELRCNNLGGRQFNVGLGVVKDE